MQCPAVRNRVGESSVPLQRRRSAFERYIDDPIDGATPEGLVDGLARLRRGELLSRASTERLISIMSQTRTGANRLRGGLAPGVATGARGAAETGDGLLRLPVGLLAEPPQTDAQVP